ncbi:uncharacterized protein involved in exopolysaccharide biosynthesis [Nonomuraea thailandensis]|uniref:Uncharacterized protein involved in exopolysaccharide biosynthesis n=1 Tax=Nonomuraea thailandensis TaxID=1188745 RepID=A0A9X2K9M1_9ACTN|nr:hypothetical protein [Nonomuraea thailandensis]MCP2365243.1 uncharacterized protein involved in exopolysaccharide biosynthesis [Nonomuraea thailandensis]
MTPPRRRLAVAAATLTLAALTTACGAIGQAVDCTQATQEINKITTEYSSSLSSAATDPKAIEKASQETADKLKTLASKYDGDLASAVNDMAAVFESIKVDDMSGATEALGKLPEIQAKATAACG